MSDLRPDKRSSRGPHNLIYFCTVLLTAYQGYSLLYASTKAPQELHLPLPIYKPPTWPNMNTSLEHRWDHTRLFFPNLASVSGRTHRTIERKTNTHWPLSQLLDSSFFLSTFHDFLNAYVKTFTLNIYQRLTCTERRRIVYKKSTAKNQVEKNPAMSIGEPSESLVEYGMTPTAGFDGSGMFSPPSLSVL